MRLLWTGGLALMGFGLALWLAFSVHQLESELAAARAALESQRTNQTEAALALAQCRIESAMRDAFRAPETAAPALGSACACAEADCATPGASEAGAAGSTRSNEPASDEQRQAAVRAYLERRVAAADPDGEMDDATRRTALELLTRIRALRSRTRAAGEERDEHAQAADLSQAEDEFTRVTGEGVGEFLARIAEPAPARPRRPGEEPPLLEGAERKRFADEVSRLLGVAEPGSVEVLQRGAWRDEDE